MRVTVISTLVSTSISSSSLAASWWAHLWGAKWPSSGLSSWELRDVVRQPRGIFIYFGRAQSQDLHKIVLVVLALSKETCQNFHTCRPRNLAMIELSRPGLRTWQQRRGWWELYVHNTKNRRSGKREVSQGKERLTELSLWSSSQTQEASQETAWKERGGAPVERAQEIKRADCGTDI